MVFLNFNYITIIFFTLIIILWWVFLRWIYKKQKNKLSVIFLFISLLFLSINIFEIKWWYNNKINEVEWWKVVFVLDVSKSMDVEDILVNNFWTNINSVFDSLENYFISDNDWWLAVIFSDLWDEKIDVNLEYLDTLKGKWIKVLLVWVGSEKWWKIPDWNDFFWRKIYKTYNGQEVVSKLNISELESISKKFDIDSIILENINDFSKISDYITKNINLIDLEKHSYNRTDLTRFFIFVSLIFFILFLYTDNFIWRRE